MKNNKVNDKEDFTAPPSYITIDDELGKRNSHYRTKKTVFLMLVGLWILSLFLYLSLPVFHVESMKFEGIRNLNREDVLYMMEVHEKSTFLTLDDEEAKKKLEENSSGFLGEVSVHSGVFSGTVIVDEDFPIGRYQDVTYFASGRILSEVLSLLAKTNLKSERKEELSSLLEEKNEDDSLMKVHLRKGEVQEGFSKKMFSPFKNLPASVLAGFQDVVYKSDTFTVMDVLYHDLKTDRIFCFENVLYDWIDRIFNPKKFLTDVLNACNRVSQGLKLQRYELPEGDFVDVYHFKIVYRQNDTIDIIKQE